MPTESFYEDVKVGDTGRSPEVAVTSEMIRTYADLTGDHTPIHVDEEYAKQSIFGDIVAHGLLGLALADGLKTRAADLRFPPGTSLGWSWDFLRPIRVGDILHVEFTVGSMRTTSRQDWGIVVQPLRDVDGTELLARQRIPYRDVGWTRGRVRALDGFAIDPYPVD